MPLLEFINSPISHDIVHNGATFQVRMFFFCELHRSFLKLILIYVQQIAGLTNNSGHAEAHEIRHCISQHPSLGHYVLEVAKVLFLLLFFCNYLLF